ncbi:MAG: TPM domain-containing protein, partial [Thiobacillus sp.]
VWRWGRIGIMVKISRWLKHLFKPPSAWRNVFPQHTLDAIETAIRESETRHHGEIRFAIETSLLPGRLWHGMRGRDRAIEVFADLRVWDTEHNSGVLIYVLLADHDIEIVADRGIATRVSQAAWDAVAQSMEAAFRHGEFERGALEGIAQVGDLLAQHFPPQNGNPNELQNRPVIVRR